MLDNNGVSDVVEIVLGAAPRLGLNAVLKVGLIYPTSCGEGLPNSSVDSQ
jgi:hypothetical protein